ncbi:MAG: hypothetical protein MSC31_19245 [Solirubrobacteraceae bacterium MAG38_C4-C5]|nr:hypothetical protein [Candidatus Siliceabacter maunaloa]
MKVVGTTPVTCRPGANKRPSYVRWKQALHAAAAVAAAGARPTSCELFSLRGIFGPVTHAGSPMKGDERIDHLDVRRQLVHSDAQAGVLAEVWALEA